MVHNEGMICLCIVFVTFVVLLAIDCYFIVDATLRLDIYRIIPNSCDKYNISLNKTDWGFIEPLDDKEPIIVLLNNPGYFPTLLDYNTVNGGIPQKGNISMHLRELIHHIKKNISNKDYDGYAIIYMDQWGMTWQQNNDKYDVYKSTSREKVKNKYKNNITINIEHMAAKEFNSAAKMFLRDTIIKAKITRPKAKWGLWKTPVCSKNTNDEHFCFNDFQQDNDNLNDLFKETDTLYPLFSFEKNQLNSNKAISSCIEECNRLSNNIKGLSCIPLVPYKYKNDDGFLSKEELTNVLSLIKQSNFSSVIIWGREGDLTSKENCEYFKIYLSSVLGPVVKSILTS